MAKVIGLTGGIASGKTTVANMIRNLKLPLIDSDLIAKEVMLKQEVMTSLRESFGDKIFDEQGKLSRRTLAHIIYNDEQKRAKLNDIVHPYVKEQILLLINETYATESHVFVDVPLLYESGFDALMDEVIVVYLPKETQLQRLMNRDNIEESYAHKKIDAQDSLEKKIKKADYVIDNRHSLEYTDKQLRVILEQIGV